MKPRRVTVANEEIDYLVKESANATEPRIDVGIHDISVVIPQGMDMDPEELLVENGSWVIEKKRKYEEYRAQIPERTFEEGETFAYLGEPHEVVIEQRSSAEVVDKTLRLPKHGVDRTSVERSLETLYRRKARERFEERADAYAARMGVTYEKIEIRNQRTKWGSCSANGTLGLNWRLMMAPPEIIDYVVVHELAHLIEQSHNDTFWSIVSDHHPAYRDHAKWLEENSTRLVFSDDDI